MTQYEDLTGAAGQTMFYRAERFEAGKLFRGLVPATDIGDLPHRLCDLSMSGLAAIASDGVDHPPVGENVPISLRINNTPLHTGYGKIVRTEPLYAGTKVAVNFTDGHLDIASLIAGHREQTLRQQLNTHTDHQTHLVNSNYRLLCVDFLKQLRHYKQLLDYWKDEESLMGKRSLSESEVVALCVEHFKPEWRRFQADTNRYVESVLNDADALSAAKKFTESVITPDLMPGPIWQRSFEKPLGYPGDHLVMDYVYSWRDEGKTLYGKFVHRLGLDALECVATRMTMMQQLIADELAQDPEGSPLRVANLACGSAQEITNTLSLPELQRPIQFSLIDQDENALAFAYSKTYPEVVRHRGRARVQCFHSSFTELMKGGALRDILPQQNLVYTIGLFDYLKQRRCKTLTRNLFEKLVPGGLLVIGNLKRSFNSGLWCAEMATDWSMHYRTKEDMLALTEGLDCASVDIATDRTDRIYLMSVRKPL